MSKGQFSLGSARENTAQNVTFHILRVLFSAIATAVVRRRMCLFFHASSVLHFRTTVTCLFSIVS